MNTRFFMLLTVLTFSLLSLVKAQTLAEKTQTATSLELCSTNAETMLSCRSFISGFLQGSLLTDAAIIDSINSNKESFFERAIRTRLGKREDPPTAIAGFCLSEERTIVDLAEEMLDQVKDSPRNSAQLAQNVYDSLKQDYPCQ